MSDQTINDQIINDQTMTIPLLKDHHNHLSFYALLRDCPNLQGVPEKGAALRLMADAGAALKPGAVLVVLGWNSGYYRFEPAELAALPPVLIVNISLHGIVMNPAAEKILEPGYPDIVSHYADPAWFEKHMVRMMTFIAGLVEPTVEKFARFFDYMRGLGVYHVEEMHMPGLGVYEIVTMSRYGDRTEFWTDIDTYGGLPGGCRCGIKGIKVFTDGALGVRTAAMAGPYPGGGRGELLFTDDQLYRVLARAVDTGKAASVHALGELAPPQVIRVVQRLKADGLTFPYLRMEHCQFISEVEAREARDLGMVLCMQPNFSTDSVMYADRLQKAQRERNNPFRMLIDRVGFVPGKDLILGSDGMPHGAEAALNTSLFPPFPGQRLTLEEFVAAYCMPDTVHGQIDIRMQRDQKGIESITVR